MKCPSCGREIANDSRFCEFCGVKVADSAPHGEHRQTQNIVNSTDDVETSKPPTVISDKLWMYVGFGVIGFGSLTAMLVFCKVGAIYYDLGYNTLNEDVLPTLISIFFVVGFGILFLWLALKYKDSFIRNTSTLQKWLKWGLTISLIGGICVMLKLHGSPEYFREYFVFNMLHLYGLGAEFMVIIGYACLLWWTSKQPKVETETKPIALKPWHVCIMILGIVFMMIVIKYLFFTHRYF